MSSMQNYYFRLDKDSRLTVELTKKKSLKECIELTAKCIKQIKDRKGKDD